MGIVGKPENFVRKRKFPPNIEIGLRDLTPALSETIRKIIDFNYKDFEGLSIEEVKEKLRKDYKIIL